MSKTFMTIRETAKTGILSEYTLRLMQKQKKVPCIMCGNKRMINYPLLIEKLNIDSEKAVSNNEQ